MICGGTMANHPPDPAATEARLQGPGVLIRTMKKGTGTKYPKKGDVCVIHYEACLEDGSKVDSSRDRALPLKYTVGQKEILLGLDVAVQKMTVGETAEITIPSFFAYGHAGCPPRIPADAVLIFRAELLNIT